MKTDASGYISRAIFSQPDHEGILHSVAFMSCRHLPAECNYKIYDKELMAIVQAFEEWRLELEGSPKPVNVILDHKNLEYFMSFKRLSRLQARWIKFLSCFNFKISYQPGAQCKADALTRRSQDFSADSDPRQDFMEQVVLKPKNLSSLQPIWILRHEDIMPIEALDQDLETIISQAYQNVDAKDLVTIISQMILNGERHSCQYSLSDYFLDNGHLYHHGKLYLPNQESLRLRIIQESYDQAMTGHPGVARTYEILQRPYYWPRWSIQCVSTLGTVTHVQEPSLKGINKESYFHFRYRHSHGKTMP